MCLNMSGEQLPEVWGDFNLDARVLEAIRTLGWKKPTTVQRACVSHCLKGHDVCVQSRTGSDKTGAFAVPLAHRLVTEAKSRQQGKNSTTQLGPLALVLVPSVELCAQTEAVLNNLCRYLKPRALVGVVHTSPCSLASTSSCPRPRPSPSTSGPNRSTRRC